MLLWQTLGFVMYLFWFEKTKSFHLFMPLPSCACAGCYIRRLQESLVHEQSMFSLHTTALERDIRELLSFTDISKGTAAAALAAKVRASLSTAQQQAELFNKREQLFSRAASDYSHLIALHNQVRVIFTL